MAAPEPVPGIRPARVEGTTMGDATNINSEYNNKTNELQMVRLFTMRRVCGLFPHSRIGSTHSAVGFLLVGDERGSAGGMSLAALAGGSTPISE